MPSILRNSNRYRRDQRQLEEEEEMWFNEEDDFPDVPSTKIAPDLDNSLGRFYYIFSFPNCQNFPFQITEKLANLWQKFPGKIIDKKAESQAAANGPTKSLNTTTTITQITTNSSTSPPHQNQTQTVSSTTTSPPQQSATLNNVNSTNNNSSSLSNNNKSATNCKTATSSSADEDEDDEETSVENGPEPELDMDQGIEENDCKNGESKTDEPCDEPAKSSSSSGSSSDVEVENEPPVSSVEAENVGVSGDAVETSVEVVGSAVEETQTVGEVVTAGDDDKDKEEVGGALKKVCIASFRKSSEYLKNPIKFQGLVDYDADSDEEEDEDDDSPAQKRARLA